MEKNIKEYSDFELINLVLDGKQEYFEELLKRYKNLVYSVVLRMVNNATDADDLAQEVFIKVYKNLDKYYPDYKFSTWIIRITTNHVIDFRRKKVAETIPLESVEFNLSTEQSAEEEIIAEEESKELNDILNNLPDMYKIPIILYHQQGLSYQEIADTINEPLSKVKNRIFRGRKMLRDILVS